MQVSQNVKQNLAEPLLDTYRIYKPDIASAAPLPLYLLKLPSSYGRAYSFMQVSAH